MNGTKERSWLTRRVRLWCSISQTLASKFLGHDITVMRARYSSRCCSLLGCKQQAGHVDWDLAQRVPATPFQWTGEGARCVSFSMTRARMSHEAPATRLGYTHGAKHYATTTATSNACPVCQTFLAELRHARIHVVTVVRTGRCPILGLRKKRPWKQMNVKESIITSRTVQSEKKWTERSARKPTGSSTDSILPGALGQKPRRSSDGVEAWRRFHASYNRRTLGRMSE